MDLVTLSDTTFWLAVAAYGVLLLASFGYVAWRTQGWRRAMLVATAAGLAAHTTSLLAIVFALGRAPWGSLYEFLSAVSLLMMYVTAFLITPKRSLAPVTGVLAGTAVVMMGVGALLYAEPSDLQPALQSQWLTIHVFLAIVGSGTLLAAAVVSAMFLVRRRWEGRNPAIAGAGATTRRATGPGAMLSKSAQAVLDETATSRSGAIDDDGSGPGGPATGGLAPEDTSRRGRGLGARLPESERLDRLAGRLVTFAFPIWTLAIIMGAVWGEQAWGRYWGWDPKETMSFVVWVLFAGYMHARATSGWKGTRAAVLALVGGGAILFNYVGVNLLVSGLHSYAGA